MGLVGLAISCFSCTKEQKQGSLFNLVPAELSGISFENTLESTDSLNILEYLYFYNGGGVAAGDINNDGLVDLMFTGNQVPSRLYLNKGNLQFEDISESSGILQLDGWSNGVTFADVNGDGFLDIYISQVGEYLGIQGHNRLLINQGDLTFVDQAAAYGVDFKGFGTHAVFLDYDRDGDLDVYLLNHGVKSPEVFTKSENRYLPDLGGDRLFKNLSAEGESRFVDVTEESGIYSSILGFGLGVAVEDFDQDGWPDIYVSNDFTENDYLYINQQDGTFQESLESLIATSSRYSMGNDVADLNGDGLPDLITTDMLPEDPEIWMKSVGEDKVEVYAIKKQFGYADQYVRNHLHLNMGQRGLAEIARYAGIHASDWSWSPLILDLDNDGKKDIHITNGIVKRPNDLDFIQYSQEADPNGTLSALRKKQIEMLPTVKLPNYAFRNRGNMQFESVSETWGLNQPSFSNGSTYADLDNDGDLELIINNLNQPAFLYENHSEQFGNAFMRINLSSPTLNPFGVGASVRIFANNQIFEQYVSSSRGFQSGPSTTLVFGLGNKPHIDSILVSWPEGEKEVFLNLPTNATHTLHKGKGKVAQALAPSPKSMLPTFPNWSHQEKTTLKESDREYLIPRSYAQMGPAVALGDVNGDQLEDLYLGGARDQAGSLFLQQPTGHFEKLENQSFNQLAKAEDVVAEFADVNGDGIQDLYVGSGGNEHPQGNLFLFDRLFLGDGKGNFIFAPNALPPVGENTSALAFHDLNGDGAPDLFVGASNVPGDYGASPLSYLLINDGQGKFRNATREWFEQEVDLGMVNTAKWADMDQDGEAELLLSGEWQGIRFFKKIKSKLIEYFPSGLENSSGWIHDILVEDIDGDGLLDILTGNMGLNSKLKASPEKPLFLYHGDFDQNGQADPLIFHYMGEKLVPFATRDDLIKQIPQIKKLHGSYQEYAQIEGPEDLFTQKELDRAQVKKVTEFRSGAYLQQEDGSFRFVPFPWENQLSPILTIYWDETNRTVYLGGNFSAYRVDLGKTNANSIAALRWEKGSWIQIPILSEIPLHAEIRQIFKISGQVYAASNDGPIYPVSTGTN